MKIKATIYENGNGFPGIGDLCYDANSDMVYKVKAWDGSDRISTHGGGAGNSVNVIVEEIGCASDIDDDDWEEIESSNYRVVVAD